jgi:hypothetical protein
VQVQNVPAAARELPAQLDLKRMAHVVVNDDPERPGSLRGFKPVHVVTRGVTHAAAVRRANLQKRHDCKIADLPGRALRADLTPPGASLSTGMTGWLFGRRLAELASAHPLLYIRWQGANLCSRVFGPAGS